MAVLSVLVPVYNVEPYLEQCLESLTKQTYTDMEIICMDDGSTDTSGQILNRAAERDSRIRVIHKANSGYGSSMNLALAQAKGEYIGIVESDDYISPDMYECLMARARMEDWIDLVKSAHYEVEDARVKKKTLFEAADCEKVITGKDCKNLFAIPCNIWSAIYRKNFLLKNEIRFLETPGASYQDTSFYFKTVMMAEKIVLTNHAYYYYRTDNTPSSVHSSDKIFYVCDEIREIDRYMETKEITDAYYTGVRNAFMFRTYYWNYSRLHILLKWAFYQEFKRELIRVQKMDEYDRKYWTEEYWNMAEYILADVEQFFWNTAGYINTAELDSYTVQREIYEAYLETYIKSHDRILIYGAGVYGNRVYDYLCRLGMEEAIQGYVVSVGTESVPSIYSVTEKRDEVLLIVAAEPKSQVHMLKQAKKLGFTRILRVDECLWNKMENRI